MYKYLVYIDKGASDHSSNWKDTLDEALAEFKQGIEEGHDYGCLEFLMETGE